MEYPGFMRLFLTWLLCFTTLVQGQSTSQLVAETPPCALTCFIQEIPAAGCSLLDVGALSSCLCTNSTLLADVTGCIRVACPIPDQVQAQSLSRQLCQGFPVENQSGVLTALAIVSIVVAIPSIALRWLARYRSSKLGWDDYTALGAAAVLGALASIQIASVNLGFGKHIWEIDPRNAIPLLQFYWVSQQFYILAQLLIKVSTLAMYLRVFPRRWFRITVLVGIALMAVQDTVFLFLVMIRCLPVDSIWDARTPGKCLNLNLIGLTGAIAGITEHFVILLLPLPELWKLKLSRRKRIQLALVFSIGSFSCITSLIRVKYVSQAFAPTQDISWDILPVLAWSLIEELSAVVCINLPPCRHLIGRILPRGLMGTSKGATTGTYATNNKQSHSRTTHTMGVHMHRSIVHTEKHADDDPELDPEGPGGEITTEISGGWGNKVTRSRSLTHSGRPKSMGGRRAGPVPPLGPLPQRTARRPYTAHGSSSDVHRLDVEIDSSELGLAEVVEATDWTAVGANPRGTRGDNYGMASSTPTSPGGEIHESNWPLQGPGDV